MKGIQQKYLIVYFLSFFCLTSIVSAKTSEKIHSFTIECAKAIEKGFYGVASLNLELGEEISCSLILDHKAIGLANSAGNKLSTNLCTSSNETVIVTPEHGETDGNGRFRFTITAKKKGSEWVSWAVTDNKGEFNFSKDALNDGLACGMFVKVK